MGLCRKDSLLTKFFEKKGNKIMRDKIREWLENAEDCDVMTIWNDYGDYSQKMLYYMDDIDEVLSNCTVSEIYDIIAEGMDNNFSFGDAYFSYDSGNDEIRSRDRVYDLLTIDDENNLVSYMLAHKTEYKAYSVLNDILNPPYGFKSDPEGLYYQTEKRKYNLYEGKGIKADTETTSDIIFIMDDTDTNRAAKIVSFVYGASVLDNDIKKHIERIVADYEEKEKYMIKDGEKNDD